MQLLVGDWISRVVATAQPIKLAAIEGLAKTTRGAPEHLLGWYTEGQVKYGIAIPKLLSLLAFHNPNAVVKGLDTVPADRQPPVNVVRVSFQLMVAIGTGSRHSPRSTCSYASRASACPSPCGSTVRSRLRAPHRWSR